MNFLFPTGKTPPALSILGSAKIDAF
jgi:hypothetical protein